MRGVAKDETQARVTEAVQMVRLSGLADRLPRQLSGGQQQRVALARALVTRPDVLLLDEPLSNLDAKLREAVRVEIRQLQKQLGITTVMVTHDQEEALIMADRMVVMSEGSVRQVGTQRALYEQPADRFVAGFVGRSNLLAGRIVNLEASRPRAGSRSPAPAGARIGCDRRAARACGAGVGHGELRQSLPGTVEFVSYLGASIDVHVRVSPAESIVVSQPNRFDGLVPKEGDRTEVCWQSAAPLLSCE